MKKEKLISFNLQGYLALIPYLGLPIVLLTSFYNIYRIKNRLYVGLYYLLTLLPLCALGAIAVFVGKYLIMGREQVLMLVLFLLLAYFMTLCMAIVCIYIEKAMITRLKTAEKKRIENNIL